MAKYSRRLIQTTHSTMLGITMAHVTIRTTTITLRWVFGLILAFSLAMPVMAKISACDTSTEATLTTCTGAQQSAYDLKIYSQSNSDFSIDDFDDANALNKYREYLDKIIEGYTPNDEEFQEPYLAVRELRDSGNRNYRDYFGMVTFFVGDVYPDFHSTLWEESDWEKHFNEFDSDFHDTWTKGDWQNAYIWALRQSYPCEIDMALCDTRDPIIESDIPLAIAYSAPPVRITDRVVELLGGGTATKDSLYIENGYRTTGFNFGGDNYYYYDEENYYDYRAFGVWAQDSYWGFWEEGIWEADGFNYFGEEDVAIEFNTLFIAGGRNHTKPTTGTWRGLAVGKHKLLSRTRVGRSEIIVNLDASEVDVNITGIAILGSSDQYLGEILGITPAIQWKGIPLSDMGLFRDVPKFGVHTSLDDVFVLGVPVGGTTYGDTAYSIAGQFYGENGDEVTGTFEKLGYLGSFGAYKELIESNVATNE